MGAGVMIIRARQKNIEVGTPLLGEEGTRHSTGTHLTCISLLGRGHTLTKHHQVPHRLCREAGGKQERDERDCFELKSQSTNFSF